MHAITRVPSRTQRSVSLPARSTARRGPHSALIRPQKSLSRENLPFPLYIPGRPEKYIPTQWGGASPMWSRDHQEEEVVGPRRPYKNAFPRCASPYREKHSELAETPGLCSPMSPIGGRVEAKLKPCRTACSRR